MTSFTPISLTGENLGQRHHCLNSLVDQAYQHNTIFESIQMLPEATPIDRLFKIDLASKYRHVEYILHNLKDEDVLYVSRSLKSLWLLEPGYDNIINPINLEDNLYPEMLTTSVNKMKHWISLNLRDPKSCQKFFDYYADKNFDYAIKFLRRCTDEYILIRVTDLLHKLTPHHLKLLSEKCPSVAKVYFDKIKYDERLLSNYLKEERKYFDSLKCLLKMNPDIFLDITEKYFNQHKFQTFSSEATKYILSNNKNRFDKKPELYTAMLLNVNTLAKCLDVDEIKDLVPRLARAEYLNYWFSYKNVEPLIKRLGVEERTKLKKQVFVDKTFGEVVSNWPYDTPSGPEEKISGINIFQDKPYYWYEYEELQESVCFRAMIKKRKYMNYTVEQQTPLDQLFDLYRFTSFEKALSELRRKLMAEGLQNRQNMMLVLVSKTGGRFESVEKLLMLLVERHENEPVHLRATVIRSLVKRSNAWRLPESVWDLMLRFGRDLGLDGSPPVAPCIEGLHAVVLRNLLTDREFEPAVWEYFLKEFSTLKEYKLTASERRIISTKLPALLLSDAEVSLSEARLNQLLDTLDAYTIRADKRPGVLSAVKAAAQKNTNAESLLYRLFNARIARKELFKENFPIIQTGPSYFNALKHDASILQPGDKFEALLESINHRHERFLRALALYFGEENGLAENYLSILERKATETPKNELARPLALLAGAKLIPLIRKLDESPKDTSSRRLANALRANSHLSRPLINVDLDANTWKSFGAKAIANRVLKCSSLNAEVLIDKLLSWKRTERLAFVLSIRIGKEYSVLATVAAKRPKLALKTALWHLRGCSTLDTRVWDIIIPLITKLDVSGKINERLRTTIKNVSVVPLDKKFEYCATVFDVFKKISKNAAMPVLCELEHILSDVDDGRFIGTVIKDFLDNDFLEGNVLKSNYDFNRRADLYVRIIAKYLLLSKTESTQKFRFENVGRKFLGRLESFWETIEYKSKIITHLDNFIRSLKYTKVFLSPEYVSCLPIFENIVSWMQKFLPVEMYFDKYVQLHLSMLFFKSIKQGAKNNLKIFEDLPRNLNQATEIVGTTFGRYIAHEIKELKDKYFESVVELYQTELVSYVNNYFAYDYTRILLIAHIIKGILKSDVSTHLLAQYVYSDGAYSIKDYDTSIIGGILDLFNESQNREVKFFLNANDC